MKQRRLQQKEPNYLAWGFGIPCGAMLLVMLINGFSPFGSSSMLYSDCYHQYFPFFKAFCHALRSGDSLLYSFNVGMGLDYLGLISYYLASPLYLLGVLIPDSMLLGYFSLLTPIRLGLAGLFFALFLKKTFHKNDFSIAIFGSFYALCAWALGYQWNVMWLDTFALLPLVALGMHSLLSERKFVLYTVALFLSVFSNYYIGFFTCIFVFLSFICYEICRWEGFKKFLIDLAYIALFSIIAIGMTAVLELSAFSALQTTQSSVNKYPKDFALNIADKELYQNVNIDWKAAKAAWKADHYSLAFSKGWSAVKAASVAIFSAMEECAGNMNGGLTPTFKEGLPNLYCGIGTIIFAFLFLTCKEVKLRDKICSVVLLLFLMLSFILRQLDYIWHGFHFPNMIPHRFSFLYSFVMLYMAYRAYLLRDSFKLWQVITACLLAIGIGLCSDHLKVFADTVTSESFSKNYATLMTNWKGTDSDWQKLADHFHAYAYPVYNGLFLLLYTTVLLYLYIPRTAPKDGNYKAEKAYIKSETKRKQLGGIFLTIILCLEIGMNMLNFGTTFTGTNTDFYPRGKEDAARIYKTMHEREAQTAFYRAETTHTQTLNDGALNGYNGVTTFTSSANVKVTEFMKDLGYGAKNTYNRYSYEESSPVSNLFLNLKYMIERNGNTAPNSYFDVVANSGDVYLLENNAYLPLGFMTSPELAQVDFNQKNTDNFDFQNQLVKAATGISDNVWRYFYPSELEITSSENVSLNYTSKAGYCTYTAQGSSTISFTYTPYQEGLMCFNLHQTKRNGFTVYLNGKKLYSETYSLPQMLSVCDVKHGDTIEIRLNCKSGENGTISLVAGVVDENVFRRAYNILNESTLQLSKFSNTKIQGNISCARDGLLYTSIPQNRNNWSVKVDGKKADIVLIGDCMIGVYLPQGDHRITFTYHNSMFVYGLIISLVCFAAFITLWIIVYKPRFDLSKFTPKKGKYQKKTHKN